MLEIVYGLKDEKRLTTCPSSAVRWLNLYEDTEYLMFNRHLMRCGLIPICEDIRNSILTLDTEYCGLFLNEEMIGRACVEKYSADKWEVSDICVEPEYRNRSYAKLLVYFAALYVLQNGRMVTIRAEEGEHAIMKVIAQMGFVRIGEVTE